MLLVATGVRNICSYNKSPKITYDPSKRRKTCEERGLDFADAPLVFTGKHFTREDDRKDYGETRLVTVGILREQMVVMVWTPRNIDDRHIISMRKANEREQAQYTQHLD
ncbi:BrnT family toxin [Acidithiobacillus thiooxidans]|uniref:BrnT family toxin n=1 Tax=Acidithiobacillus thiooxidans TaxID=930 RepID=UPI00286792F0|nr:BrnT family toxin [Acidithiobacillus thiooxidans]MDR7926755.1 BrnT family toxin [Acidithiobacillus thiooxidans]